MKIKRRQLKKPRVEMLPLIDSVFLILVFFIYAFLSMTVHRGLPVDLPTASSAVLDKKDYISVTVDSRNQLYLNKEEITLSDLNGRLRRVAAATPDVHVYINGDEKAAHGTIVGILDLLQTIGIEKVSIETNAPEEQSDE